MENDLNANHRKYSVAVLIPENVSLRQEILLEIPAL